MRTPSDFARWFGALAVLAGAVASPTGAAPVADRAVTRWLNLVAAARAKPLPGIAAPLERELYRRSLIDAAARNAIAPSIAGLTGAAREAAKAAVWGQVSTVDADNLAYVKSVLPADGWFRHSRDGEVVASHAWLIVHHSTDWAFKRQVLAAMTPLVAAGEVRPSSYALFYDRVMLHDGKPQRYGSQLICEGGRMALWQPVEDLAGLDARRAAMGLEPIADYMKDVASTC